MSHNGPRPDDWNAISWRGVIVVVAFFALIGFLCWLCSGLLVWEPTQ